MGNVLRVCAPLVMCSRVFILAVLVAALSVAHGQLLPVIINTWPFVDANYKGKSVGGEVTSIIIL